MKYALFVYEDESIYGPDKNGPAARQVAGRHLVFSRELGARRLGGAGLAAATAATTVRTLKGIQSVHDGPFAAMKEQLGGFYLIEAPDMDAAIAIAMHVPVFRDGSVEIRPLLGAG